MPCQVGFAYIILLFNIALAPLWYVRTGWRVWYAGGSSGNRGDVLWEAERRSAYASKTVAYQSESFPVVGKALRINTVVELGNYSYAINSSGITQDLFTTSLRCLHQP